MSTIKDGGPAFPAGVGTTTHGMSLRDYCAAKAMQAMLSACPCQAIERQDGGMQASGEDLSLDAYDIADAMLRAREAK